MAGIWSRLKVWADNETLMNEDLNAEFNNVRTKATAEFTEGYSTLNNVNNLARIQSQVDPAPGGNPLSSTANASVAGELERLRYAINRIMGTTYWYESPSANLESLLDAINVVSFVPANRIVSGRVTTSAQPMFLTPQAATNAVTLKAATTDLVCYIDDVQYTFDSDISLTGLTLGGSGANYTATVINSAYAGQQYTKTVGEDNVTMPITGAGSAISAAVGTYQMFKVVSGGNTEYFWAFVESTSTLSRCYRGFLFNSSDAWIPRIGISNGDTVTLLQVAYIFLKTNGTLDVTYNKPLVDGRTPTSPASGDYWFDLVNQTWKKYNGTSFDPANAIFVGFAAQDSATTVGCRSIDFFKSFSKDSYSNLENVSSSVIRMSRVNNRINVYGNQLQTNWGAYVWDKATDFDTGVTNNASTRYWLYLSENGLEYISDVAPHNRIQDLMGLYHPAKSWKAVGQVDNNSGSSFGSPAVLDENYRRIVWTDMGDRPASNDTGAEGNYVYSDVNSAYSNNTGALTDVGNLTITMKCTGRPLVMGLLGVGVSSASYIRIEGGSSTSGEIAFLSGSTVIQKQTFGTYSNNASDFLEVPPTSFQYIAINLSPGEFTFKVQARNTTGGSTISMSDVVFYAYEL